jgi:UDPglucose--hexose-1-phosphate uridylyltransferase
VNDDNGGVPAPNGATTQLVWNPLTDEYLAQSPGRMWRREGARTCPFCADLTSGRVPPGTQAWVRPNDFPALLPPVGECLVLIYSPEHDRTFADLTPEEVERVIGLWLDVYADLAPRYACVMTWETSGEAIGQTQRHPHGQTYGVAILPPVLAREMASVERAAEAGEGCPFCRVLAAETDGPRVVAATPHWLAFVPPYARYPYEVHIYPRRHVSAVGGLERASVEVRELAELLPRVVRAYNQAFQGPMPYMLAVHQLADERFHLHVELLPVGRAPGKLKLAASSEMAWGLWLNDALPEEKAAELRAILAALAPPRDSLGDG